MQENSHDIDPKMSKALLGSSVFGLVSLTESDRRLASFRSSDAANVWLGGGLSGLTGARGGDMVIADSNSLETVAEESTIFSFDKIETSEKLRSTLEVSAAASYRGLSVNAAGHASYYRDTSLDKYSLKVYGRVDVRLKRTKLKRVELTDDAKNILSDRDTFFANFGDLYVDQIVCGGTYILMLDFSAESQKEFESMQAGVTAAMTEWSASSNIRKTFERVFSQRVTSAWVLSNGVARNVEVDPQKLIDQLIEFPDKIKATGGVPIGFDNLRATTAIGATHLRPFRYTEAAERFLELARLNDQLAQTRAAWTRVQKTPHLFVGGSESDAAARIAILNAIERNIHIEAWDKVVFDALNYKRPSEVPQYQEIQDSDNALPKLIDKFRPQIKVGYKNNDDVLQYKVINLGEPSDINDAGGWVDVRSGGARIKRGFSIEFLGNPPGLQIEYRMTFSRELDLYGWVRAGTFLEDAVGHRLVTGVAVRLVGPMASQYRLHYMVHCVDVGDSSAAGNGYNASSPPGSLVSNAEYAVQGLRIVVVP